MANGSCRKKEENLNPRRLKFAVAYLEHGNAVESARQAGYSERYALAHGYELARSVNVTLAKVARAKGLSEHRLIAKYETLIGAKTPKWNPISQGWDTFDDNKVQLEATRDLAEIIEPRESQTSLGVGLGHGKDGKPTLQVIMQHTVGRPDRSKQAVKKLEIPVKG